jgi:hypothetical protein
VSDLDIRAMTAAQVADFLSRSGPPVTEADVLAVLAAGAPSQPDGTINFLHYAAWLTTTC